MMAARHRITDPSADPADGSARACEVCGSSLDGRRPQAVVCSGACRAEKSRRQGTGSMPPTKAHRKRTRRVRQGAVQLPGVAVYLPDLAAATDAAAVLRDAGLTGVADALDAAAQRGGQGSQPANEHGRIETSNKGAPGDVGASRGPAHGG